MPDGVDRDLAAAVLAPASQAADTGGVDEIEQLLGLLDAMLVLVGTHCPAAAGPSLARQRQERSIAAVDLDELLACELIDDSPDARARGLVGQPLVDLPQRQRAAAVVLGASQQPQNVFTQHQPAGDHAKRVTIIGRGQLAVEQSEDVLKVGDVIGRHEVACDRLSRRAYQYLDLTLAQGNAQAVHCGSSRPARRDPLGGIGQATDEAGNRSPFWSPFFRRSGSCGVPRWRKRVVQESPKLLQMTQFVSA
jgi:hypothetical protein